MRGRVGCLSHLRVLGHVPGSRRRCGRLHACCNQSRSRTWFDQFLMGSLPRSDGSTSLRGTPALRFRWWCRPACGSPRQGTAFIVLAIFNALTLTLYAAVLCTAKFARELIGSSAGFILLAASLFALAFLIFIACGGTAGGDEHPDPYPGDSPRSRGCLRNPGRFAWELRSVSQPRFIPRTAYSSPASW